MMTIQKKEDHGGGGPGDVIRMAMMKTVMTDKQGDTKGAIKTEGNQG